MDEGAVWVFLLVAEQGSCCVVVESQQLGSDIYGRRSVVEM
jgi:hypothetical protein